MKKIQYSVNMHCASCAVAIEKVLKHKVSSFHANPALKLVNVEFDENTTSSPEIVQAINKAGYDATEK